jgi:hypothetical protein
MRPNTSKYILTALCALAMLLFSPALQANQSITLSNSPYTYEGQYVGPYTMNISPSPGSLLAFCLDGNQYFNPTTGILASPTASVSTTLTTEREDEVAFLAAYSLNTDPTHTAVATVEGPVQFAIWSIMSTLPTGVLVDVNNNKNALALVTQAVAFYNQYKNTSYLNPAVAGSFMNGVRFWTPDGSAANGLPNGNQRFVTVTPEPGTVVFLGTGVLLLALSRIRRRR